MISASTEAPLPFSRTDTVNIARFLLRTIFNERAVNLAGDMDTQPSCPWLIVHADKDELIDIDESVEWVNKLDPGPELIVFADTTHFFHGKLVMLRRSVEGFVTTNS